jgi:hypothetical protein
LRDRGQLPRWIIDQPLHHRKLLDPKVFAFTAEAS